MMRRLIFLIALAVAFSGGARASDVGPVLATQITGGDEAAKADVFAVSGKNRVGVDATQAGAPWSISASSLPLPAGAATSANQTTEISSLGTIAGLAHGQNATFVAGVPAMGQLDDTSTTVATEDKVAVVRITPQRAEHVNLRNAAGTEIGTASTPIRTDPTGTTPEPVTQSGTWTVQQGSAPWSVSQSGAWTVAATQSGAWTAGRTWTLGFATDSVVARISDGAGNALASSTTTPAGTEQALITRPIPSGTQTVAGTVTANQGTSPWLTSRSWSLSSGGDSVAAVESGTWAVRMQDGSGNALASSTSAPAGSEQALITRNIPSGTQAVSAASLPLPTGASTAAKQPALGTAGTASADVITIQGIASMTAVKTDGSGFTQPVSGTVTAKTQDGAGNNLTSQASSAQRALDVGVDVAGVQVDPRAIRALINTDVVKAQVQDNAGNGITSTTVSGKQRLDVTLSSAGVDGATAPTHSNLTGGIDPSGNQQAFSVDAAGDLNVIQVGDTKATYSAAITDLVSAALATDIFTITGSSTKTVRVTRIEFSGTETTGAVRDIQLIKRSAANSAGTSTTLTAGSFDSTNAAATATVRAYTANPTLGATVAIVRSIAYGIPAANLSGPTNPFSWDFGTRPAQIAVLRGTSEVLSVNLNGVTLTGSLLNLSIEWTEE